MFISDFTKPQKYGRYLTWLSAVLILLLTALTANAQRATYRIVFKDKGQGAFAPGTPLYDNTLATFHQRALDRRKAMGFDPLLNEQDRPIDATYIQAIRSVNDSLQAQCNWSSSIIATLSPTEAALVRTNTFVKSVTLTSAVAYPATTKTDCGPVWPGESFTQLDILNVLPLLESGVSGSGTIVGIIDNGFDWRGMSSLQHANVLGTFDVIYGDTGVGRDPTEPNNQVEHGSEVFSAVAAWLPGQLTGTAPFASYLLAKSEDMRFEERVEEDNLACAVEWAERNGADAITSSVGYYGFDSTQDSMKYEWLDGNTTIAARAYNAAAQRGVMVLGAAGNDGPLPQTLITPGDADSAINVGGCRGDRTWWPSSSRGPTADGRMKPDIAAMGSQVPVQIPNGSIVHHSGTSLATPQIAGCCVLLKQLFPQLHPWEIRAAMYSTGTVGIGVGDKLGHGIPDLVRAAQTLGTLQGPGVSPPTIVEGLTERLVLCAVFSSFDVTSILTFRESGIPAISASEVDSLWVQFPIQPSYFTSDTLHGRITVANGAGVTSYPSDSTWFDIPKNVNIIPCGVRIPSNVVSVSDEEHLGSNFPLAPFIHPNPVGSADVMVFVKGVGPRCTNVRIVSTSTGIVRTPTWHRTFDGSIQIDLPTLVPGHYTMLFETSGALTSLPLIVL